MVDGAFNLHRRGLAHECYVSWPMSIRSSHTCRHGVAARRYEELTLDNIGGLKRAGGVKRRLTAGRR